MRIGKRLRPGTPACILLAMLISLMTGYIFSESNGNSIPNLQRYSNASGEVATNSTAGRIDLNNPFFQSLGTNGRSCASCHLPDQGWSIEAAKVKARFDATGGLDPIFRTNDGSNCDRNIDTSTLSGRASAYSLLTTRGLIRIAIDVPSDAEFEVTNITNPYGCSDTRTLSVYRRPLPTTNLAALTGVMWDGRESTPPTTEKISFATNPSDLLFDLAHQSNGATLGHAQALVSLTAEQQKQIVEFEMGLSTAQISDNNAGDLYTTGANGGPVVLNKQQFYVGINDPLGGNPSGAAFTPLAFSIYEAWSGLKKSETKNASRASIARGEAIFNSRPIHITNVTGLNDDLGIQDILGTCTTCHDSPNIGNHSIPLPLNIGVGDVGPSLSDLPIITLRNKSTQQFVSTTDPGRALITGKWKDIGKMKGPILRGLAARAPYFHNGAAATLQDVIQFYDVRFNLGLSAQEQADLLAFLEAL